MPSSFKKSADLAPVRYRTPSPPRLAFEPISPIFAATAADELLPEDKSVHHNGGAKRPYFLCDSSEADMREQDYLLRGPMDAFASIALAIKSSDHHRLSTSTGTPFISDGYHDMDRPSKRAKSEKLPLLDWPRTTGGANPRPATSYEQSPESRRLEAELLLNFAHEAAKLSYPAQESPQIDTQLLVHDSRPLRNNQAGRTFRGPKECARGAIDEQAFNPTPSISPDTYADRIHQAEFRTPSYAGRAIDERRSASDADLRYATYLEQRTSDDFASENPPKRSNPSEIELRHLSPTAITQQGDLNIPPKDCEKGAGKMRTEMFGGPEVEHNPESLRTAIHHEMQNNTEVEDHFKDSVTNVNDTSRDDIPFEERYIPADPAPEDTTQSMEDVTSSLQDAVQALEGQEGGISANPGTPSTSEEPQADVLAHELRTVHGALGDQARTMDGTLVVETEDAKQTTPAAREISIGVGVVEDQNRPAITTAAICASCNFSRNSLAIENDNNATSWISCDGCKSWFHFACAGFKNDREVRSVDKYRCRKCRPLYGSTTYVRKSSRAHSAIDYAGLHQGVIKTSDERPEHHYIKPIKDGTISFLPETFARMRPELVTSEYFEKGTGMREPIIIPACLNSRLKDTGPSNVALTGPPNDELPSNPLEYNGVAEDWFSGHTELETVLDQGQDALDMVIPQGLTVRQVAELYGQDEKVEVIDVKSQNGENKKWNMRRWADYYENPDNKVVRNVISLEISQSKLGRLIRRPQIVRDLDLQDSVWPQELLAKGEYPRVQFYCLMSVADCFTDFHIDFGGSSVFYHILKGKKTFLFIPPKEKYLKRYEEWCMSPAQNWTFLGDQTKECYRVDLSEGDTMLIPAGWIHAVWTPEDSLVIGGNFLTRLNFGMQLRVAQVEKATGVARKFRYPHFQKLHWYTALRYLEDDPLPRNIKELLHAGGTFARQQPTHTEFDSWGENSRPGIENYHTRYYSQPELDGLPDLTRYLLRTALIDIGSITDGISAETSNAVKKSIPRGYGEPLDILKTFAAWCAWKRGNESIPHWAYPDAEPETLAPDKLSAAATKKLDREAALQAPRRQSARMQSQQAASEVLLVSPGGAAPSFAHSQNGTADTNTPKKSRMSSGGTNGTSHRKTACESCRKRRRACKHKGSVAFSVPSPHLDASGSVSTDLSTISQNPISSLGPRPNDGQDSNLSTASNGRNQEPSDSSLALVSESPSKAHLNDQPSYQHADLASQPKPSFKGPVSKFTKVEKSMPATINIGHDSVSGNVVLTRPRHKACNECRKSKRRCIHDEHGNEDPVKISESAIPRPHARKSSIQNKDASTPKKHVPEVVRQHNVDHRQSVPAVPAFEEQMRRPAPIARMIARPASPVMQKAAISCLHDGLPKASSVEPFPLDPALFEDSADSSRYEEVTTVPLTLQQSPGPIVLSPHRIREETSDNAADEWQITGSCSAPGTEIGATTLESRESFGPPASSLVSPPASSHDDAGISPINAHAGWKSSTISSRHSSSQPKQMQRYTPESGSMRRASSSSYGENAPEKPASPATVDVFSDQTPKPRIGLDITADEESMRLIKELQAEEYGLRRRGKA